MPNALETGDNGVIGILLAAGLSRRFGPDKIMQSVTADGIPMVLVCAHKLQAVSPEVLVVIRPEQQSLRKLLLANGLTPVPCILAHLGMGHSLSCGIAAAPDAPGWLIALADQPHIEKHVYRDVYSAWCRHGGIVRPTFQGQIGHPVAISAEFGRDLRACRGDQGARQFIEAFPHRTTLLPVHTRGVIIDVDKPSDIPNHP